jgi:hypothetical protein
MHQSISSLYTKINPENSWTMALKGGLEPTFKVTLPGIGEDSERWRQINDDYGEMMSSIQVRLGSIKTLIEQKLPIPDMIRYESCCLQIRKVCESIAICCAIVHDDIVDINREKFRDTWNLKEIIRKLGDLHPDFYPTPAHQFLDLRTGKLMSIPPTTLEVLSKEKIIEVYNRMNKEYLHSGSIKDAVLLKNREVDFSELSHIWNLIWSLLAVHKIKVLRSKYMVVAKLKLSESDLGGHYVLGVGGNLRQPPPPDMVELYNHISYLRGEC